MNYLIDTHAFLWIVANDSKLSNKVKSLFLDSENLLHLSMASIWEMAVKISLKKLSVGEPLKDFLQMNLRGNDVEILNIKVAHIFLLENLPFYHRDPFDRMIISQSISENIPIISADKAFDFYPIKRIW
ncbi:MAG: PIN domain-containing protein [Actinobacteria bacterium]|nr:PIN domain-containing protein [Actinomycetota bacterium]